MTGERVLLDGFFGGVLILEILGFGAIEKEYENKLEQFSVF